MHTHIWTVDFFPDGWLATCEQCHIVVSMTRQETQAGTKREVWYAGEDRRPSVSTALDAWGSAVLAAEQQCA